MKTILKSKTFWTAIVAFLVAFVSWAIGDIKLWTLLIAGVTMLGAIFWRDSFDTNLRNLFNKFKWWKDKAVWTAIAAALGLISTYLAGEIGLSQMLIGCLTAIVTVFLKSGASATENEM